jgi:hypothetical protein
MGQKKNSKIDYSLAKKRNLVAPQKHKINVYIIYTQSGVLLRWNVSMVFATIMCFTAPPHSHVIIIPTPPSTLVLLLPTLKIKQALENDHKTWVAKYFIHKSSWVQVFIYTEFPINLYLKV